LCSVVYCEITVIRGVPIFVVFVGNLIHEIKNPTNNYTWEANEIIHKHVHVDYNPLKGMLVINIVNCPLCSWSRKSRSFEDSMAIYGGIYWKTFSMHDKIVPWCNDLGLQLIEGIFVQCCILWNHCYSWGSNFRGFRG
jgi:hypothetical protein